MIYNKKFLIVFLSANIFGIQAMEQAPTLSELPFEVTNQIFLFTGQAELKNFLESEQGCTRTQQDLANANEVGPKEAVQPSAQGAFWKLYKRICLLRKVNKFWNTNFLRGMCNNRQVSRFIKPHAALITGCFPNQAKVFVSAYTPLITKQAPLESLEQDFLKILKSPNIMEHASLKDADALLKKAIPQNNRCLAAFFLTAIKNWGETKDAHLLLQTLKLTDTRLLKKITQSLMETADAKGKEYLCILYATGNPATELENIRVFVMDCMLRMQNMDTFYKYLSHHKQLLTIEKELVTAVKNKDLKQCSILFDEYYATPHTDRSSTFTSLLCALAAAANDQELLAFLMHRPLDLLPFMLFSGVLMFHSKTNIVIQICQFLKDSLKQDYWEELYQGLVTSAIFAGKKDTIEHLINLGDATKNGKLLTDTITTCRLGNVDEIQRILKDNEYMSSPSDRTLIALALFTNEIAEDEKIAAISQAAGISWDELKQSVPGAALLSKEA